MSPTSDRTGCPGRSNLISIARGFSQDEGARGRPRQTPARRAAVGMRLSITAARDRTAPRGSRRLIGVRPGMHYDRRGEFPNSSLESFGRTLGTPYVASSTGSDETHLG